MHLDGSCGDGLRVAGVGDYGRTGDLRMALFELLHEPETPQPVVIDEALEIAKRFSTPRSSQFINGILDGVLKTRRPGAPAT